MTDGYKKALELIAENKRSKSPILDLGNLGLTEVPEEVFDCVWLENLNLGLIYFNIQTSKFEKSFNNIENNLIEKIPQKIEKLQKLRKLSLNCNYLSDIEHLSTLKNLTELDISDNYQIVDISPIKDLINLRQLFLSNNLIQEIRPLSNCLKLEILDLTSNFIKNIDPLIPLSYLTKLQIGKNLIEDLSPVYNLHFLKKLEAPENELNEFLKLELSSDLTLLDLSKNKIHKINFIGNLPNLKSLHLYGNNISDLSGISHLLSIRELNLGYNKIQNIDAIIALKYLRRINLKNNLISNIDAISNLVNPIEIDLRNNKIFILPESILKLNLDIYTQKINQAIGIYLSGNPLGIPPVEIIEQKKEAIKIYFNSLYNRTPLNQLKTLIIGDAHAGKTSLLKKIIKKEFDPHESTTHGIKIHPYDFKIDDETVQANFWDFGGQEIMHGTHTFFYSKRSIYILVLDARREGKEDYWLKHIESFGGDSPVLVALNKIDENPSFDVNRAFLQKKYPNIRGFLRVSCATEDGIEKLVQELEKQIHALEMRKTPFAKSWFEVKEALDRMGEHYISYDRYYELCKEKEVTDEIAQTTLLQFLHDLGIVLAFRELELHDTQVINPLWLTNAVYRIINSPLIASKGGQLELSDLNTILNDPKFAHEGFRFPKNKFLYIVQIMNQFELCYRLAEKVFMVPDLLSVEEKEVPDFDFDSALRFVLQYDFFPTTILPRFMVQLHARIIEGQQWRTGVVLEDAIFKSKAVVKADRDEKRLYIWVKGEERDKQRAFFNFIRKTLQDIHNSFEKLDVTELVPLPDYEDEHVEYKDLVGNEEMGIDEFPVGRLRAKFSTDALLNGIEAPERRRPRRHAPVKVFVSYSQKDMEYKDELITALAYLERMEEIELWQDGRIMAGKEWKKEIFEKLAAADIVICLVSSNFIASDFCFSVELKEAMEAHEKGQKIIVPIQIKKSGWNKLEIGKIQGVPAKPISAFSPRDDGWAEVFAHMEAAVKQVRKATR